MADEIEIIVTATDETEAGFASARAGADAMAGDVEGSMGRVGAAAEEAGVGVEGMGVAVEGAGGAAGGAVADFSALGAGSAEVGEGFAAAAARGELFMANLTGDAEAAALAAQALEELGIGVEEVGVGLEEIGGEAEAAGAGLGGLGAAAGSGVGYMSPFTIIIMTLIALLPALSAASFSAGAALLASAGAAGVFAMGFGGVEQAIGQLMPSLGLLKGALSQVFAAGLDQEMGKLGQVLVGFETPLKAIAASEVDVIKGMTGWIRSSDGIATIDQALLAIDTLVKNSAGGWVALERVLIEFVADAQPKMAAISQAISYFFESWERGVAKLQSSGDLSKVFDAGAQAIRGFADLMSGLLDLFAQISAKAGPAMAQALTKIGDALSAMAPFIGSLFEGFAKFLTVLASVIEAVGKLVQGLGGFGDVGGQVLGFLVAFVVSAKLVVGIIGSILTAVKLILPAFSMAFEGIAAGFAALAANPEILLFIAAVVVIVGLAKMIMDNWGPISQFFDGLFQSIGQGMDWLGHAFSDAWTDIGQDVKEAINAMLAPVNAFIQVLNALLNALSAVASAVSNSPVDLGQIGSVGIDMSQNASGTFATGGIGSGLALVGEHGPELVDLPGGSSVMSNPDADAFMGGGGGGGGSGNLQFQVTSGADQAVATMIMQLQRSGKLKLRTA